MAMLKMPNLKLKGKRVLIREDLNVPIKHNQITSDSRIRAALPTIKAALKAGAKVMIMSHLGRPEEGVFDEQFSLAPIATALSTLLKTPVPLISKWVNGFNMNNHSVVLLENVRFNDGETDNDLTLAKKWLLCAMFL